MSMVEIKADIKVDDMKIGDVIIELTDDDFYELIRRAKDLEEIGDRQDRVVFRDINGNYNENFTIPTC